MRRRKRIKVRYCINLHRILTGSRTRRLRYAGWAAPGCLHPARHTLLFMEPFGPMRPLTEEERDLVLEALPEATTVARRYRRAMASPGIGSALPNWRSALECG